MEEDLDLASSPSIDSSAVGRLAVARLADGSVAVGCFADGSAVGGAVALAVAPFGGRCADDPVAAAARLHYGADDAIGLSAAAPLNGGADSTIGLSAEARVDDLACSLYSVVGSLVVTYIGGISAASFCTVACIDSIADGPCNAVRYFIRGLVEQPQALYSEGHFPLVDRELLDYVEGGDVRTTACPGPACQSFLV